MIDVYNEQFSLTVLVAVAGIAAKVGKGLDPDVGGEYTFKDNADGTISTSFPCTTEFKAQAIAMTTDANLLYQALQVQYETRWPELTPPTLAECEAFDAAIVP